MKHVFEIKPVRVQRGSVHTIEGGKGLQITSIDGVVWVTQANDGRDIILSKGQSFILDRKGGLAVVYALKEAAILVGPAGHVTAAAFDLGTFEGLAA